MIKILLNPKKGTFVGNYPKDIIDNALSAKVPGAEFSPRYRQKDSKGKRLWDGKLHLLSVITNSFPLGVISIVEETLKKHQLLYEIVPLNIDDLNLPDNFSSIYNTPIEFNKTFGKFTLRDYQVEAIEAFLKPSSLPYRGVLSVPTGGGKTLIGSVLANILNVRTLFLVHGKNLKEQNLEIFREVFKDTPDLVGTIDAKTYQPAHITVASVDTLYSRLKNPETEDDIKDFLKEVDFVICDECHRATSNSFKEVINITKAPLRLGLSGTPLKKEDNRDLLLHSVTGPILYKIEASVLKEKSALAPANLIPVLVSQPKIVNKKITWPETLDLFIINNNYRHDLIAKVAKSEFDKNKTILILVGNSVPLAHNIFNLLTQAIPKNKVGLVTGKTAANNCTLDALRTGTLRAIVTTTVTDEGIDVPSIDTLLLVGGGASYNKTIQRVGRGLRPKSDGRSLLVYDFMDTNSVYLANHAEKRLQYYQEEGLFENITAISDVRLLKELTFG